MNKIFFLLIFISLVIVSCKNNRYNRNETAETNIIQRYNALDEAESEIYKVTRKVDKNFNGLFEVRKEVAIAKEKITSRTKGSDEYLKAERDLKRATEIEQEFLDSINSQYAIYLGFLLSSSDTEGLIKAAQDKIKASIHKEMLIEYSKYRNY